jgi:glycine/D-amino acid oxidase-like deaminating enzyme
MIIDSRSVPTGTVIETEVCIVGAGAAGITLAREFINSSFRVILLESGGAELEQATQDLYAGRHWKTLCLLPGFTASIFRRHHQPLGRSLVRYAEFA